MEPQPYWPRMSGFGGVNSGHAVQGQPPCIESQLNGGLVPGTLDKGPPVRSTPSPGYSYSYPIYPSFFATLWVMWGLSSLTRDWTSIPCIGRWNLNPWTTWDILQPHLTDQTQSLSYLLKDRLHLNPRFHYFLWIPHLFTLWLYTLMSAKETL